jgi:hypothetical protein
MRPHALSLSNMPNPSLSPFDSTASASQLPQPATSPASSSSSLPRVGPLPLPHPSRGLASLTVLTPSSSPAHFNWAPSHDEGGSGEASPTTAERPRGIGREGEVKASRWGSIEFRAYELVVALGVGLLCWKGASLGRGQSRSVWATRGPKNHDG